MLVEVVVTSRAKVARIDQPQSAGEGVLVPGQTPHGLIGEVERRSVVEEFGFRGNGQFYVSRLEEQLADLGLK
jgi:hypothetical protein